MLKISENLNLSSLFTGLFSNFASSSDCLSYLLSKTINTAHTISATTISSIPIYVGLLVSEYGMNEEPSPRFTNLGTTINAVAVPKRANASCNPIANAISLFLNHFAIERVTATPAISLPSPNIAQPRYAIAKDGLSKIELKEIANELFAKL